MTDTVEEVARLIEASIQFEYPFCEKMEGGDLQTTVAKIEALSAVSKMAAQTAINTLKSLGWLSPADLADCDRAVRDAALEMAASTAYKWWDGEPEDGADLRDKILALKSTPTRFQEVPEIEAIFYDLASKQQPMDPEIAKVLNENIEELYEP